VVADGSVEAGWSQRTLRVRGTVQGVGYRPFVYRSAQALGLRGFVRNDPYGVLVVCAGPPAAVAELRRRLAEEAPPLARVEAVEESEGPDPATGLDPTGGRPLPEGFEIRASGHEGDARVPVAPDTATCPACLAEIRDPANRRYRYPFTNCTDCGPRYTIVRALPYDRPQTTMAGFPLCPACQAEYDDPGDRRFHAQPNACPACGPRLRLVAPDGTLLAEADGAVDQAVQLLRDGGILALKGIGGYHLACDAAQEAAVAELRRRKARDAKPFALMVPDLASAEALCRLDDEARAVLCSGRRPIVLARRRPGGPAVAEAVAPGLVELGVMLPYSPLHHLLLDGVRRPLVMTSGNRSDEPICQEDDDALVRLGPLADALLQHDRPIHIRCDDSVVRATPLGVQLVRRSRGFAPEPLPLPPGVRATRPVLALGAELKATVAVAQGGSVVASHHLGDLEHLEAFAAFEQAVEHLPRLSGLCPEVLACDLHPEYLSTKHAEVLAEELGAELLGVQHHHAHLAALLVDRQVSGPVLGVAFDGFGYGTDGTLWGGELLVCDLVRARRVGRLLPVALPGGSQAVREPWRMAVAWLAATGGDQLVADEAEHLGFEARWPAVLALCRAPGTLRTSSAGRLFDAVAALLGVRQRVSYEGQAAVELEALAATVDPGAVPVLPMAVRGGRGQAPAVLDPRGLLRALVADRHRGVPAAVLAAAFHRSLAEGTARLAGALAARFHLDRVALSGGVFQNVLLSEWLVRALEGRGLEVLAHRQLPPNDGSISIGQAAVAAARQETGATSPPPSARRTAAGGPPR
jgi:hydrogenase maturation protein HypF